MGLYIFERGFWGGCLVESLVLVTRMDIEEVLSGIGWDQLHVMVADVIKSFNTVGRSILDCALLPLGMPGVLRIDHSQVRLRFKLAAGLGEPWCRDGGISQRCLLSMVFIVGLHVPWCRGLEVMPSVRPQLYHPCRNQFRTISGVFGINQQIRIRISSLRIFLNDSKFWCVQSSITSNETVHVRVLWPDCAHTNPFRMLWCS